MSFVLRKYIEKAFAISVKEKSRLVFSHFYINSIGIMSLSCRRVDKNGSYYSLEIPI